MHPTIKKREISVLIHEIRALYYDQYGVDPATIRVMKSHSGSISPSERGAREGGLFTTTTPRTLS